MQILKNDFTLLLQIVLEMLREIFSQGSNATKNEGVQIDENPGMKGCLEWMYEMLIGLVANLLDGMKPEDKLIIVAPEVCNSVYVMQNLGLRVWFVLTYSSTQDM
jgi:hypothetical protein